MFFSQCCGTEMTFFGFGSGYDLEKFQFRFWIRIQTIFSKAFDQKKFVQNLAFSRLKAELFIRKLGSCSGTGSGNGTGTAVTRV